MLPAGVGALLLAAAVAAGQEAVPDTLRRGPLELVYQVPQEALARRLADVPGLARLPALPADVLSDEAPVRVWLAPNEAEFVRLSGGHVPEWGAGIALLDRNLVVLPAYSSTRGDPLELARVLRHELAHVALHRYLGPARIPRWFHEGYARWAAGEWDLEAAWMLRLAFALRRAPPLDSLSLDWPAGTADARVAYLLSTTTVVYLTESGGERGLALMLQRWRQGRSLDQAMRATYGVTLGQFEEDWRAWVKKRYGWAFFLSSTLIFWAFATLLLLALFVLRRRRDRERMEQLRRHEPPDDPAYWLERTEAGEGGGGGPQAAGGEAPGDLAQDETDRPAGHPRSVDEAPK